MLYSYYLNQKIKRCMWCTYKLRAALLATWLIFGVLGPGLALGVEPSNFKVEMIAPQKFRIQPRISGPVSSSIMGSGGNQTLITRQENGRTIIDAEVPVGAVLHLQVGESSMRLQMVDSKNYKYWEE
jgi:hypothetical protein